MAELSKEMQLAIDNYGGEIKTLKDTVTAIRQLPGMYCSGRGNVGFLSLIREIYQNSIDQVIDPTSPADTVELYYNEITLEVIVKDNGKGFPFDDMVRMVTSQHTSKNYNKRKGEYSSGLHGSGLKVVNALSTECTIESYRYDGCARRLDLSEGYIKGKGPYDIKNKNKMQGSVVRFIPSIEVLGNLNLEWKVVYTLIKDILSLTPIGTKVLFEATDSNNVKHREVIINKDGIITKLINSVVSPICKPIIINYDNGEHKIDVAFTYDMGSEGNISSSEEITAFCNMCPTMAGEHISGTVDGITRWFSQYMNNIYLSNQKAKDKIKVAPVDIKSGLNIMISGFCLEPTFVGQAKEQLSDPNMYPFCKETIISGLDKWSKNNPQDLAKLSKFFKDIAELRTKEESGRAKIVTKYAKNSVNNLPAKYVRPLSNKNIELIIVEGDSALGTVRKGRDPQTQGLFPIRGKIPNAFKTSKIDFFNNEEVQGIIQIIFNQEYKKGLTLEDCKVDKVIFMADADVDGSHIAALLLRMFVMYFPFLIEAGKVYKAIPPLLSAKIGKNKKYFTEQIDIIKYIQNIFVTKYELKDLNKTVLNKKDTTLLFLRNADYIYHIDKISNTYAINKYLLELVLNHYVINKRSINYNKLRKDIKAKYRFMDIEIVNDKYVVKGNIEKSNLLIINDKFINDCDEILKIIESNDAIYYYLNNEKSTIYNIMEAYNSSTPTNIQRYKGLGEMDKDELAESTLYPGLNRTLVRYTMENIRDTVDTIRSYESNSKKILSLVRTVTRDDLID